MRIAIIQFPGSTCARETSLAVARAGMTPVLFLWNDELESLTHYAGYILVGGFSYEDRSRAGIIAALHPLMARLKQQSELGKPILGICNGAQILVEAGLVPGLQQYQLGMALTTNKRIVNEQVLGTGFYHAWVHMRLGQQSQHSAFTRNLKAKQTLHIPIAHAEGRFQLSKELWNTLQGQGCTSLHYCDEQGNMDTTFPTNPNGSAYNLAAITNAMGNVMAMMPHPERAPQGDAIFQSMREYIAHGPIPTFKTIAYATAVYIPTSYHCPVPAKELIIESLTTDNQAMTVEQTLGHAGLTARIKRYTHWELHCSTPSFTHLIDHAILHNPNKEHAVAVKENSKACIAFLIRDQEDMLGQQKKEQIQQRQGIKDMQQISHSTLWLIDCAAEEQEALMHYLFRSYILFNPHAQKCHYYPLKLIGNCLAINTRNLI